MSGHSPGPWKWEVVEDGDSWLIHSGEGETPLDRCVLVAEAGKWPPSAADAALIASAPALSAEVAALKERNRVQSSTIMDYAKKLAEANGKVQELDAEVERLLERAAQYGADLVEAKLAWRRESEALRRALGGYEAAFRLPANAADALDRMCPSGWHHVDITVRIGGADKHYQGDWLKEVWYARKHARDVLGAPVVDGQPQYWSELAPCAAQAEVAGPSPNGECHHCCGNTNDHERHCPTAPALGGKP